MININLRIIDIEDIELRKLNRAPYLFTRVFALVAYKKKKKDKFFFIRRTIVDTGAVVSLLPRAIWEQLDIEFLGSHQVKGIVKKKECILPVKIGLVKTKLLDEQNNQTPTFTSLVYCADSNEVPIIFGMKDALDKFKIEINTKQKQGYLIYLI